MTKKMFLLTATMLGVLFCSNAFGQKIDRGIEQGIFIPKGQWVVGGSLSYSEYDFDEYKFLVLDKMNASGYNLNLSPFAGYFIKDDFAVGARFGYKRTEIKINNINFDLGDDVDLSIKDYYNVSQTYYGTAMMRNYLNLGKNKRFGLFNETRLTLGGGQGKLTNDKGQELTGTYHDTFEIEVGMAPGLTAFVSNRTAIEVSVGLVGWHYRKVNQITDQVYKGSYSNSGASFKVNLFSINIGASFYL